MSTLKLIIEKGPRNGETLEFNTRSAIRLGRVVRGNNVSIKDPGISTKHLEIHFHSGSGSGKWILTDLDSSNGTILNSTQIQALIPVVINDNDLIKVGELTAIRVLIVGTGNRLRRGEIGGNLRVEDEIRVRVSEENEFGGGIDDSEDVRVSLEENDAELGKEKRKGRGRLKKVNAVEGNEGNTRRTRNSRKEVDELVSLDVGPVSRARRAKKVDYAMLLRGEEERNLDEGGGGGGEVGNVGVAESKWGRGGRGRARKKDVKELEEGIVVNEQGCTQLDEGGGEEAGNVGGAESKRGRGGRGRTRKKDVKELEEEEEEEEEEEIVKKEQPCRRVLKVEVCEEGNVKGGVETRNTRSSRREVKEFVSLDVGMPARRTRTAKNVKNVGGDKELESLGEVESKKKVEVKEELDVVEESPIEEIRNDLVKAAVSERVELSDQSSEEGIVDATQKNVVEAKVSSERKRCCVESMDVVTEQNELEEKMNSHESLDVVTEQNELEEKMNRRESLDVVTEQNELEEKMNRRESLDVVTEHNELDEKMNQCLLDVNVSEHVDGDISGKPINEIVKQIELNEEVNTDVLENLENVDASIAEKDISDKLESNLGMEDEIMEESEETSPGYDGEDAESESLKPPNLEKMTLGEWFDCLEVYLPKQIHAQTDAIVEDMRKRARQFDEFMLQHSKEKGKLPTSK